MAATAGKYCLFNDFQPKVFAIAAVAALINLLFLTIYSDNPERVCNRLGVSCSLFTNHLPRG